MYVNKWMVRSFITLIFFLANFKADLLVHIREFNGEKPTKKGIALKPEQYNKIKVSL